MAPRRSTDNSRTLFPCRKVVDPCDLSQEKEVPREAQAGTAAWAEKTVGRRSIDTGPCRVEFPVTLHMRDRRIAEMSVIVHGQRKIKTILCKRPSPTERKFWKVGLCKCLFDVICMKHQMETYTCVGEGKQVKQAASAKSRRLRKTRVLFLSWLSVMLGSLQKVGQRTLICVQQPVVPLRRRSRSCATYFARGGHACEEFHRGLVLVLLDLHTQGQRTVQDCSSRDEGRSRERMKNVTRTRGKTPKPRWVSRMMLLERRLRRRLCRIIARIVSSNMPTCRLNGVVALMLYLFAA